MIKLLLLSVTLLTCSCVNESHSLFLELTHNEFVLSHNFWSAGHTNQMNIKFLPDGKVESETIPGIDGKTWKVISENKFSIGDHIFTKNSKHKCYLSPFKGADHLDISGHYGYHIIRRENF